MVIVMVAWVTGWVAVLDMGLSWGGTSVCGTKALCRRSGGRRGGNKTLMKRNKRPRREAIS